MKSKTLILSCVLVGLSTLTVIWWNSSSVASKIDEAFASKNYPLYFELVQENGKKFSAGKEHLLLAYGYLAEGDLIKSNHELEIALQQLDNTNDLNLEIVLNQALNAYLANNLTALNLYIDQINVERPTAREWKRLFQGVLALKLENCAEAVKLFSTPLQIEALNPQMHQIFSEKIPPAWNALQLAACEIGMGSYSQARLRIRHPGLIVTDYEKQLAHALIGKSYWLEGNTKKAKDSILYYELAMSEFSKVPPENHEITHFEHELIDNLQSRLQGALDSQTISQIVFFENALNLYQGSELPKLKESPIADNGPTKKILEKDRPPKAIAVEQVSAPVFPTQEEWELETPLDWNYAMIQGRIDSILEGERVWTNLNKQLEEDSAFLNLLTQIKPPLSPVFFLLGQVELLRERDEQAVLAFKNYVRLEPENLWGWKLLALSQVGVRDIPSAIASFNEVIKINPVDLAAWKSLGKIYFEQKQTNDAIQAYENALMMDPQDLETILALNQLYNEDNDGELAIGVIHGVYKNHSGNPLVIQALRTTMEQTRNRP